MTKQVYDLEERMKQLFSSSIENKISKFRIWNFIIGYYLLFGICFLEFLPNIARILDVMY